MDASPASPEEEKAASAGSPPCGEEDEQRQEQGDEEEAAPVVLKKGPWTTAEDAVLVSHVRQHGEGNWNAVQRVTGLLRCGKSCRLRWTNHLRPNLKKGSFSPDEELLIAQLHAQLGNKWARMASHLPGRTDNEIKNYWNTRTKRRQRAGLPVYPPEVQLQLAISKRCRYDDFSSASPMSTSPPISVGSNAVGAGYTSARPAPLDLAGQLAMAHHQHHSRPAAAHQFLAPFSAPASPWAPKPFARNAHYFHQFPHSSPVSPTTPTGPALHPVTPELSLGSYGLPRRFPPPLSPSPGARAAELPSSQFLRPSACNGGQLGPPQQDHQSAASLEAMLQELHDAIKSEPPPVTPVSCGNGGAAAGNTKPAAELRDDMDTLFDMMIPTTTFLTPAVPAASAALNHSGSGSLSRHSSDDQDHSAADISMVIGGAGGGSAEQDWSLDGGCQWNDMSSIC